MSAQFAMNESSMSAMIKSWSLGSILCFLLFSMYHSETLAVNGLPPVLSNIKKIAGSELTEGFQKFIEIINANEGAFSRLSVQESEASMIVASFSQDSITSNLYDSSTKTLFMGRQTCATGQEDFNVFIGYAIHEFGHSVFEPNIHSSFGAELDKSVDQRKAYLKKLMNNPKEAENLPVALTKIYSPFHELFADTVAVLFMNDPEAVSNGFSICDGDDKSIRNYSYPRSAVNWNSNALKGMDFDHDLFDPVRSKIWELYIKRLPQNVKGKAIILKALMDTSIEMINTLYSSKVTYVQWKSLNQQQINEEFIQLLDKAVSQELLN